MIKYMITIAIATISFSNYASETIDKSKPKRGINYKKLKKKTIRAQRIYNRGNSCRGVQ
jgi:hypothetical protein